MVSEPAPHEIRRIRANALAQGGLLPERLTRRQLPFRAPLRDIFGSRALTIRNVHELKAYRDRAQAACLELCRRLDPATAVPVVLHAISECYYGPLKEKSAHYGPALKTVLAYLGRSVYGNIRAGRQTSLSTIEQAIWTTGLFVGLDSHVMYLDTQAKDSDYMVVDAQGIGDESENIRWVRDQAIAATSLRGKAHRTLSHSQATIWSRPGESLTAIDAVVRGEDPRTQSVFRETLFADIPKEARSFWWGIWARLHAAILSLQGGQSEITDYPPICFYPASTIDALPRDEFQAMQKLFWEPNWYSSRANGNESHLIVERPMIHIDRSQGVSASSFMLIGDSLNWFIEASVLNYDGGERLPRSVFQKHVSEPFEDEANALFRRHGCVSGKLSENGSWSTQDGKVLLRADSGEPLPGEIDALAFHPGLGLVFVAECKVLAYPVSQNRLRNIVLKIQETDSEGFFAKQKRKIAWLARTTRFRDTPSENYLGVVLLDRKLPGMKWEGERWSLDIDTLDAALKDVLNTSSPPIAQ